MRVLPDSLLPLLLLGALYGCMIPVKPPVQVTDTAMEAMGSEVEDVESGEISGVQWSMQTAPDALTPEDGRLRWERSDGAVLELEEGWLVVYVLVLETCASIDLAEGSPPPPHGLPDHDSAQVRPHAIPLHDATPVLGARRSFPSDRFCAVGVALFRGEPDTENSPEEGALNGVTLALNGRLKRSLDAPWEPLALRSALAAETDLLLPEHAAVTAPSGELDVRIVFHPEHLLDAVDLAEDDARIGFAMLENLSSTASLILNPAPQESP
ncbi:MAG: hypothetical protein CL927_20125 [Deltaproteobacteria bacterium]|nr:hypothetical protein [Deltaproteobacteria bacterium]HCH62366.1 hypothetical protein [Deltaproteobacteria bacterium]